MQIVTNTGNKKNHLSALTAIIDDSEMVVICSGWMKVCGLDLILPAIDRALARAAQVLIYTNSEHTDVDCVRALKARPDLTHRNVVRPYLHTKLYYGKIGDSFRIMVGSANVTSGGLSKNEELSHLFSGHASDPIHTHYMAYLRKLAGLKAL